MNVLIWFNIESHYAHWDGRHPIGIRNVECPYKHLGIKRFQALEFQQLFQLFNASCGFRIGWWRFKNIKIIQKHMII